MSVHRLKRPLRSKWWPRALIVLLGLAGVSIAIAPTDSAQVQLLVAKHDIFEGDRVALSDFETKPFSLGASGSLYLSKVNLPSGSFAQRQIMSGELVSKNAIGLSPSAKVPIALTLTQKLPHQVVVGRLVDVWATPVRLNQAQDAPEPIALSATITALTTSANMGQNQIIAELLVASQYVSPLLLAQADGSVLSLVLNPIVTDG